MAQFILFICSNSQSSIECVNFAKKHSIPVAIVRLDSSESKEHAMNSKKIKVTAVPTLIVIHVENIQQYVGKKKIIDLFRYILSSKTRSPPHQNYKVDEDEDTEQVIENSDDEIVKPKKKNTKKTKPIPKKKPQKKNVNTSKKKKKKKIVDNDDFDDESEKTIELIEYVEPEPKKKDSKYVDINSVMRSMKQQMDETRGWKEEDLPHY